MTGGNLTNWTGTYGCTYGTATSTTISIKNFHKYTYTPTTTTGCYTLSDCEDEWYGGMMSRKLVPGVSYDLPDGSKIIVDLDGNYKVDDKDAVVTYKSNRNRAFSPHLNASDMVGHFLKFAAGLKLTREEVLGLPLKLFISWLVIEAAKRDGDPYEGIEPPERAKEVVFLKSPKCLDCGRYIPRLHYRNGFPFCDPIHASRRIERVKDKRSWSGHKKGLEGPRRAQSAGRLPAPAGL